MVTYQQDLKKNRPKKTNYIPGEPNEQPKKTNYIPGEPKETNKVIFRKKTAPKIYCYIPAAPEKNFKKSRYQKKRITYQMNLTEKWNKK